MQEEQQKHQHMWTLHRARCVSNRVFNPRCARLLRTAAAGLILLTHCTICAIESDTSGTKILQSRSRVLYRH
jgi:hypothetical protein